MATSPGAVCDGASRQMQGCAQICRQTFSPYIEDLCWLRRWRCKGEKTRLVSWWLGWSGGLSQADLYVSFFICLCVYVFYFDGFFFLFPFPPHSNSKTWAPFLARCLWAGNESEFHSVSPHPLQSRVLFPKSRGTKLNQTNNQTNKQKTFSIFSLKTWFGFSLKYLIQK